jgi:hypothetical protein
MYVLSSPVRCKTDLSVRRTSKSFSTAKVLLLHLSTSPLHLILPLYPLLIPHEPKQTSSGSRSSSSCISSKAFVFRFFFLSFLSSLTDSLSSYSSYGTCSLRYNRVRPSRPPWGSSRRRFHFCRPSHASSPRRYRNRSSLHRRPRRRSLHRGWCYRWYTSPPLRLPHQALRRSLPRPSWFPHAVRTRRLPNPDFRRQRRPEGFERERLVRR